MWIEVFRAGSHIDSSGKSVKYTESDISNIANNYNSSVGTDMSRQAPLVKGHPQDDSPAYGWIDSLKAEGASLYADAVGIDRELYTEIKEGKYRNISIALSESGKLRHVGILGAASPAVKGMEPIRYIEFSPQTNEKHFNSETPDSEYSELTITQSENEELKKELKELGSELRKEKMLRKFTEMGLLEIPSANNEQDGLLMKLADLEDQSLADDIIEQFATLAAERESISSDIRSKRREFAEELAHEYKLPKPQGDISHRSALDQAVQKEISLNPSLGYEDALTNLMRSCD